MVLTETPLETLRERIHKTIDHYRLNHELTCLEVELDMAKQELKKKAAKTDPSYGVCLIAYRDLQNLYFRERRYNYL